MFSDGALYETCIEPLHTMIRQLSGPVRWFITFLMILLPLLAAVAGQSERIISEEQCSAGSGNTTFRHLVVLVHGYLGSDREQEYLGETLVKESKKLIEANETGDESCGSHRHELVILSSKANVQVSTDGIAMGGKRLAAEISEWVDQQAAEIGPDSSTVLTFSLIGNSLGGLYSRYALGELDFFHDNTTKKKPILPLIFCTTSSPHLGVSQETFIELPRWVEPHVATVFQQQTMDDLFMVKESSVVKDMCLNPSLESDDDKDYLFPLQQFQKRIAVANAYKTDFLVSVSSGAFLSLDSDSVHHRQESGTASTRLIRDMGHVALQVVTKPSTTTETEPIESRDDEGEDESKAATLKSCVDSLDKLGWHKIFIDTRNILPDFINLKTPELESRDTYTSKELKEHFETYGTLLPIAHPLNMANSKTDLYRKMTESGQPIMDALAELLVLDMVELSEKKQFS